MQKLFLTIINTKPLMLLNIQFKNSSPSHQLIRSPKKISSKPQQKIRKFEALTFSKFSPDQEGISYLWKILFYIPNNLYYHLPTLFRPNTTLITKLSIFNENPWFSFNWWLDLKSRKIWFYVQHKTCRSFWVLSNDPKITQIKIVYRKLWIFDN